jgi:hypothetical protein
MKDFVITSAFNPFDPINDFVQWFMYDENNLSYHTCQIFADIAKTSKFFPKQMNDAIMREAAERMVELFPERCYKIIEID